MLQTELETLKSSPPVPNDEQRTVLCFVVDAYPRRFEKREIVAGLSFLSDAKIGSALDWLVKGDFLEYDDGRGSHPDEDRTAATYYAGINGRIYVEDWRRERGH